MTFGGSGFGVWRQAKGLVGMQGYSLQGSIRRRISRRTTLGVSYQHSHLDYPKAFGEADINTYNATFATQLSRNWTAAAAGGIYQAEVQGLEQVAVDPAISALLGVTNVVQTFYQKNTFPKWSVTLSRHFQRAQLSFQYGGDVSGGNGVYLTSRQQSGSASFNYTAARKWSFSANAGNTRLDGIGQNLPGYSQITGGGGISYSITNPIHIVARYDARHQELVDNAFNQTSYRVTFGISFSPGDIPLAFH